MFGYKAKQVRDQIHSRDVAALFLEFYKRPRMGEVYNLGGGRGNSLSILETIDMLATMGFRLIYNYVDQVRTGDHICYISNLGKRHAHVPGWKMRYSVQAIIGEIAGRHLSLAHATKP